MAQPAAVLSILVNANTAPAVKGLLRVNQSLTATEAHAGKSSGALKNMAKTAAFAGAAVGAAGLGAALVSTVKVTVDFEKKLSSLEATTKANRKEMARFRAQALKAGLDTAFSAREAADAQIELAKGGLSVRNIMKGGLKSALALAAAGELELKDAAATTANALNLFGLRGKDSIKVADALATAANATTADVADFAMALTQSGGVAKTAGLSFKETVLALEALANAGTKNSDAGTSLKTSIIQLLAPSKKQAALADELNLKFTDQAGNFKNLSDISDMLRAKTEGMTKAQRIATFATLAGTDGVRTLTALYDAGAPKLDKWRDGLGKAGTAAEVAKKKQDNLAGAWEQFKGALETAQITLGTRFLPSLTSATKSMTKFLVELQTGKGEGGRFADSVAEIARAFRDMRPVIEIVIGAIKTIQKVFDTFGTFARDTAKAVARFWTDVWTAPKKAFGDFLASMLRGFAKVFEAASHLPLVGDKFDEIAEKTRAWANQVDRAGEKTKDLGYELKKLPKSKRINIKVDASVGAIKYGGFNPLTGRPQDAPPAGGPGSILDQIGGATARKVDGKKLLAMAPGAPGSPGSAPGKLGTLEQLGHRMGLYTSSGYRPGDPGFHGQNRARDLAGSPANMLAYAKMLYSQYGTSINELIHTPLGVGIDNHHAGRLSSLYPAATLADHYDHVHIALAGGRSGGPAVRALVGEEGPEIVDLPVCAVVHTAAKSKGMMASMRGRLAAFAGGGRVGTFGSTSYGPPWGGINGMGVTATGVDLTRSPHLHGIAVDPNVLKLGSKYWLSPNPFGYKGPFKAFDTGGAIKGNRVDFYDWRGRNEQYGWGRRNVTVYGSDPFGAVKKVPKKAAEKLSKIVKPKKKGTLNRKPYGGIGKGGILDAFIDFQTNRLNMNSALAALNDVEGDPSTFLDDIAVAVDAVKTWETWLGVAQQNKYQAGITTTATNLKSARDRLKELTTSDTSAADAALAAERSGLLEQLLREANQRTAVSQAQYGALKYGGQFADGGVVPGPIGSPRVIVAHGGETVTPAGGGGVQVVINGDIINTPRGKQAVEVRDIRVRQRALPGRGGGG